VRVLALDTATEACSAALWIDGTTLAREAELDRGHAERILGMIDELLAEAGTPLRGLDAIAFGRGPGSFTGVRLAASVTQGLAFGAGVPVVPISDLRAVAQRVLDGEPGARVVLVCNDARMHEVYWACFNRSIEGLAVPVGDEQVGKPTTVALPAEWLNGVLGAGRGFAAYPELRASLAERLGGVHDRVLPRSLEIAALAVAEVREGRVLAAEDVSPVYLRNDIARPSPEN